MKKNFFKKKLASALALALVVASVSPVSASAATAAKIVDKGASTPTAILYVDKVAYGKSAVNFDLSKTYAGTTYTWTVSDSKKATIGAKTGYVVAKAPGVVTVKVAAKTKAGKTTTFTTKVTIRKRATAVAAGEDVTLSVGETKTQAAVVTPSNSTDAVKYVSDKPEVATVDAKTGAVTAVKTGEATITVYAKAASAAPDNSKYNVSDSYKVTVTNAITKVAAVSPKKLAVTFAESLTGTTYTKDNFVVLTSDTSTKNYIQSIATSADGKTVTLTFYSELTSGKTYDVTATFGTLVLKGSVPFVKGAVTKIVGENQVVKSDITGSNAQAIAYNVFDENGLDITDSTTVTFESNVTVNADGTVSLANGVLAYVTVVYTNPTTGAQIKSNTFTVTGSDVVATAAAGVTLVSTTAASFSWPTTVTTTIPLGTTKYAYVKTTDQYGNAIVYGGGVGAVPGKATYTALDPSIFVVDSASGLVTPIAAGTGQLKVVVGNVTQIYSITVTPALAAKTLALDSATVAKASLTNTAVNYANLNVNVLDQNGAEFNAAANTSSNLTATLISGPGYVALSDGGAPLTLASGNNTITFKAGDDVKLYAIGSGQSVFKITSADSSLTYITVAITVYAADVVTTGYSITGITDLDVDAGYNADNTAADQTTLKVSAVNANGFVVKAVTDATIKVVDPDSNVVTGSSLTGLLLNVKTNAATVGTYTVTATVGSSTIKTGSFKVVDTGVAPSVYLTSNTITKANLASNLSSIVSYDSSVYTFKGIKFVTGNSSVISTPSTYSTSYTVGSDVTLYNVKIQVENSTTHRVYEINTNTYITVAN